MELTSKLPSRWQVLNVLGVLLLVLMLLPFIAYAVPGTVGAEESYIVNSGSMEPAIQTGDVIFVYDTNPRTLEEGQIIAYNVDGDRHDVTTHRVHEVVEQEGQLAYTTKGDANEEPDQYQVRPGDVIGYVPQKYGTTARIPMFGHVLLFAQTKTGIITLVFVPAGLLVLTELWSLYRAATSTSGESTDESESSTDEQLASTEEGD